MTPDPTYSQIEGKPLNKPLKLKAMFKLKATHTTRRAR
jgi:hypothetical protein